VDRKSVLTNFSLLYLMVVVVLWVGLGVALYPFNSATDLLVFLAGVLGIGLLVVVVAAVLQVKLISKNSVWLQPASNRVGSILVNTVVLVWLCVVGFLFFVLLNTKESNSRLFGVAFAVLAAIVFGRYLQKRFSIRSLLPYGISFLAALIAVLAVFVAIAAPQ
jgi:hypothetical protein